MAASWRLDVGDGLCGGGVVGGCAGLGEGLRWVSLGVGRGCEYASTA